jgi:molybdate transport system ATP-binding protein
MITINITKDLHTVSGLVLAEFKLETINGELMTLFGPSGVGKTTLMRMIAGLEKPKSGTIIVDGEIWFDSSKNIDLSPQKRSVGFVFQDYALFPTMSVRENLLFAADNEQQRENIDTLLKMVELTELSNRAPHTLSGGQKQRVALIRALVREPKILLLDEPLSALDPSMREKLQNELFEIHKKLRLTTLLVSHDIAETVKLSNRMAAIESGKIVKICNPLEYFTPHKLSGKLQFIAQVLKIEEDFPVAVVTLLVGSSVVSTVITSDEAKQFEIGSQTILASKAFNPILMPVI